MRRRQTSTKSGQNLTKFGPHRADVGQLWPETGTNLGQHLAQIGRFLPPARGHCSTIAPASLFGGFSQLRSRGRARKESCCEHFSRTFSRSPPRATAALFAGFFVYFSEGPGLGGCCWLSATQAVPMGGSCVAVHGVPLSADSLEVICTDGSDGSISLSDRRCFVPEATLKVLGIQMGRKRSTMAAVLPRGRAARGGWFHHLKWLTCRRPSPRSFAALVRHGRGCFSVRSRRVETVC